MLKKLNAKTICAAVSVLFGFVSLFSLFMPMFYHGARLEPINGWEAIFGFESESSYRGMKAKLLEFSFLNFMAYGLLFVGFLASLLCFLRMFDVFKLEFPILDNEKLLALGSAACYAVAGILFFGISKFASFPKGARAEDAAALPLLWGAILTGTLLVLAAACMAATLTFTETAAESVAAEETPEPEARYTEQTEENPEE